MTRGGGYRIDERGGKRNRGVGVVELRVRILPEHVIHAVHDDHARIGPCGMPMLVRTCEEKLTIFDYDTIINRIGNRDPGFLGRFQTEIRSGNQLRVNAIYKEGRDKLVAAFVEGGKSCPYH